MKVTFKKFAVAMTTALAVLSTFQANAAKEIVVSYKDDVSTLDPAIGYDWQNWSMIKSLFDGLMDYKPGTTVLKMDLAEEFDISSDGLVYTFKLRKGVKFHNGRELTAQDVKYSLERSVDPKTQSPGQGFFASIKGYDAMVDGSAQNLEGVQVLDDYTIEIALQNPDATFLHVLALNFAFIVPKETVDKYGVDFGNHHSRKLLINANSTVCQTYAQGP